MAFYSGAFKMEPITFGAGRRALRFGNQKINLQLLGEEARNRAQVSTCTPGERGRAKLKSERPD